MTKYGRVISANEDGSLSVCFERHSACGKCKLCESQKNTLVSVRGEAAQGDIVAVSMPDHQVFKASIAAYLVPLCAMIAGLLIGSALKTHDETPALIGALTGLALGVLIVWRIDRSVSKKHVWHPHVTGILSEDALTAALAERDEDKP